MSEEMHLGARFEPAHAGAGRKRRTPRTAEPPPLEEVDRRLATLATAPPPPWLTPEALEAAKDLPEICGPTGWPPSGRR